MSCVQILNRLAGARDAESAVNQSHRYSSFIEIRRYDVERGVAACRPDRREGDGQQGSGAAQRLRSI